MCVMSLYSTASACSKGDLPITQNEQWLCIKATYPVEVGRWAALYTFTLPSEENREETR